MRNEDIDEIMRLQYDRMDGWKYRGGKSAKNQYCILGVLTDLLQLMDSFQSEHDDKHDDNKYFLKRKCGKKQRMFGTYLVVVTMFGDAEA